MDKKPKKSKTKAKLPHKLIPIHSSDKSFMEKWTNDRKDLLNFPWSWRMVCAGGCGVGKSSFIKSVILHADPPYERVYVCHYDIDGSTEYNDLGGEEEGVFYLNEIPDPLDKTWTNEIKTMLILEDLDLSNISKQEKHFLSRLYGYCSSHRGVSICTNLQDPFSCSPTCRRTSNIFVLWKSPDLNATSMMARRTGLNARQLHYIFNKYLHNYHDCFIIDLTHNSPAKYRVNGYKIIPEAEIENMRNSSVAG
jgi:hypothetical protein